MTAAPEPIDGFALPDDALLLRRGVRLNIQSEYSNGSISWLATVGIGHNLECERRGFPTCAQAFAWAAHVADTGDAAPTREFIS